MSRVNRTLPDAEPGAEPLLPGQALTLAEALAAYTAGSAYVNHLDETGAVAPGYLADLVVLDRDLFAGPPGEIASATVVSPTWRGGRYSSPLRNVMMADAAEGAPMPKGRGADWTEEQGERADEGRRRLKAPRRRKRNGRRPVQMTTAGGNSGPGRTAGVPGRARADGHVRDLRGGRRRKSLASMRPRSTRG